MVSKYSKHPNTNPKHPIFIIVQSERFEYSALSHKAMNNIQYLNVGLSLF